MQSLKLSFDAVTPIFILMMLGYFIKRIGMTDKKSFDAMNTLVFKVFLPVLLFYNIYSTNISDVIDLKLIIFTVVCVFAIFIVGYFLTFVLTKDNNKRGVMLQGFFRSNYAILGIPLVNYVCGEGSGALTSFMIVVIIPVFNILAVLALKRFGDNSEKLNIASLFKGVITNPLIIGCFVGIFFFVFDIKLPYVLNKAVKDISSVASPLSIVVLGSEFVFTDIKNNLKELITTVSARLIIVPFIILYFAIMAGFTGEALACILITFGAPVAISSFSMVQQLGGDEKLAAQTIVISSALCLITLFGWIFVLSYMNLF